jgi:hypothetical protein
MIVGPDWELLIKLNSLRNLCVLGVSAVGVTDIETTPRTLRLRRELSLKF